PPLPRTALGWATMSSDGQVARAVDGRALAFAEWGDPNGFPVFSLHGTPGSRFFRHYDEGVYVDAGARVITYDRPGYGGSDRSPRRRVVDCVSDVAAIADSLGLSTFALLADPAAGRTRSPSRLAFPSALRARRPSRRRRRTTRRTSTGLLEWIRS